MRDSPTAEKAKAEVRKLGDGTRVEVRLQDGTKLKGRVGGVAEGSFTVTDAETGAARAVSYADVSKVSKKGGGLSLRTKLIIGAAVAAGVIITWQIVKPALCDGGAQTRGIC